jgi:hypothetical protein
LGYCDETKAYHLWDDTTQRLVISCDVMFDEKTTLKSTCHALSMVLHIGLAFQHIFPDFPEQQAKHEASYSSSNIDHTFAVFFNNRNSHIFEVEESNESTNDHHNLVGNHDSP